MKYLTILFCLYIAALAVIPCQDSQDISSSSKQISSIQKATNGIDHLGDDACPPFCSCTCCSVSRDFISKVDKGIIVQPISMEYSDYKIAALPEQSLAIYQPPQIV